MKTMTRAELLKRFEETKVKVKGMTAVPLIDGDRLILFTFLDKKPRGIYILRENGSRTHYNALGKRWGQFSILWDYGLNYWYYRSDRKWKWNKKEDEDLCLEWIGSRFGKESFNGWRSDVVGTVIAALENIEGDRNGEQRERAKCRMQERCTEKVKEIPDLPESFFKWMRETLFTKDFMFGEKDKKDFFCTCCGEKHTSKDWKHGDTVTCARTGKKAVVEKKQGSRVETEYVIAFQQMPSGEETACRKINVMCKYDAIGGVTFYLNNQKIAFLPKDGRQPKRFAEERVDRFNRSIYEYRKMNSYMMYGRARIWPEGVKDALQGTAWDRMGFEEGARLGYEQEWILLGMTYSKKPAIEYLVKCGFDKLLKEMRGQTYCMDLYAQKPTDVLHLNAQDVARLREEDGGYIMLYWLRHAEKHGYKLPKESAEYFEKKNLIPSEFELSARLTPEKMHRYLERQEAKEKRTAGFLLGIWNDVISMSERLKLDMSKDMNLRPKELRRRHDELVEIVNEKADELRREELSEKYPEVESALRKVNQLFSWKNEIYSVQVPAGVYDIMREGRLQHHCVGSSEIYFDRIAERESYILFLRKEAAPETPWYTMEVEPNGRVRQLRTMGDEEGKDRAEAKEALKEWRATVARRMGREDVRDAEVSREKRLAEFEKLRAERNLIRNGKHAGELLVDILEADYKELNEETA